MRQSLINLGWTPDGADFLLSHRDDPRVQAEIDRILTVVDGTGWFACTNQVFDLPDIYQIVIYAYLARRAGPDGTSWPSLMTIARQTKMSVTTVKASLKAMAAIGWIRRERRVNDKGEHTSTRYLLGVPAYKGVGRATTDVGRVATNVGRQAATKDSVVKDYLEKETVVSSVVSNGNSLSSSLKEQLEVQDLLDLWNEIVKEPKVLKLTDTRRHKVRIRLDANCDRAFWQRVLTGIVQTPFLRGDNDHGWRADFDWLIRNDENSVRVLEGKYANKRFEKTAETRKQEILRVITPEGEPT